MTQLGRPREFRKRTSLMVLLETVELAQLHQRARANGLSTSAFVRRLIQRVLARSSQRRRTS